MLAVAVLDAVHAGPLDWTAIDGPLQSLSDVIDVNEIAEHLRQLRTEARDLKS